MSNDSVETAPVSKRVQRWRIGLIVGGLLLLAIAAGVFLTEVPAVRYPWVAAWLAGAIIVHDGIGAMAVFVATVIIRRFDRVIPFVVLAIVQAAAVVAVIVTVLVAPELVKQAIGTANPSILPLPYLGNLVAFLTGLAVVTGVAVVSALVVMRVRRAPGQRSPGPRAPERSR